MRRCRPKIQAIKSAIFLDKMVDCRIVILDDKRIEVRKYVVLPVDVDHFVEEMIELGGRQR